MALRAVLNSRKAAASSSTPTPSLFINPTLLPRLRGHLASTPVPIPPNVKIAVLPSPTTPSSFDVQREITVTGPNGTQSFGLFDNIYIDMASDPNAARVTSTDDGRKKEQRARWGLTRAMIANMVKGVTEGFTTNLRLVGVGYRAAQEPNENGGQRLRMKLGFSHDVVVDIPEGITAEIVRPTEITLRGAHKDRIGQFAADIKKWRKPEPYNGKGIFINDETIKLKQVKR